MISNSYYAYMKLKYILLFLLSLPLPSLSNPTEDSSDSDSEGDAYSIQHISEQTDIETDEDMQLIDDPEDKPAYKKIDICYVVKLSTKKNPIVGKGVFKHFVTGEYALPSTYPDKDGQIFGKAYHDSIESVKILELGRQPKEYIAKGIQRLHCQVVTQDDRPYRYLILLEPRLQITEL